jgi:hypothetical protein
VIFLHETITAKELLGLIGTGLGTVIVQLRPTTIAKQG